MERKDYVILSIYVFIFFLMEYLYLIVEGNTNPVKIPLKDFTIRLDSYAYFACIKVEQFIFVSALHLILPLKEYTRWLMIAFFMAIVEYAFTYNEPIAYIPLPDFLYRDFPISTAVLKLLAVFYFIWGCISEGFKNRNEKEKL